MSDSARGVGPIGGQVLYMIWLRFGALGLLFVAAACTPRVDRPVVVDSDLMGTARASTIYEATLQSRAGGAGQALRQRMLVREASAVRPLSVTFVGPQALAPPMTKRPRIVPAARPLQCVPFARDFSGIALRGNAWTWWDKAEGRYERTGRPVVGSIMVLSRTKRNPLGHLAVVTEVLGDREIVVSHANWLNRGQIHLDTPVVDVSPRNDWSRIRSWYVPGQTMGLNVYPVSGFILPEPTQSASTAGS